MCSKVYNYKWTVNAYGPGNDFSSLRYPFRGPSFTSEFSGKLPWRLKIEEVDVRANSVAAVSVGLESLDWMETGLAFRYKLHIEEETKCSDAGLFSWFNCNDESTASTKPQTIFRKSLNVTGWPKKFTICCDFETPVYRTATTAVDRVVIVPTSHLTFVSRLYREKLFTDFEIQVGSEKFECHKWMLSMRSAVFKRMFLTDMSENRENVVKMEDTSPVVVKKFLEFLYCDEFDDEYSKELLVLADKYDVNELRLRCFDAFIKDISSGTVYHYFEMAHTYRNEILKQKCLDFLENV